ALIAFAILSGGSALAHHSYNDFFTDRTVSVEGEVVRILLATPHVVLQIQAPDATYTATWGGAGQLGGQGVNRNTLKAGDHIIITGSPSRDSARHEISLLKDVRRPSDGWSWSSTPAPRSNQ